VGCGIHQFPETSELLERVEHSVRKHGLFRRGEAILVAVSGGVDSLVLLHVLHRLAPSYGWKLTVAHFNHQLRGRSSDADERLVRRTAAELGLPVVVERGEVRAFARKEGVSVEMGARKLRHGFLAGAAAERQCRSIALAHHADDQLELFFLRLLRGSGSEGLGGMRWSNPSPANPDIRLSRPLLDQPKSALYAYAAAQKLRFREDATNALLDFQRNRIRHELLPLLRKHYQPALDKTVLRLMEMLASESEVVKQAAADWLKPAGRRPKKFAALPAAVQRRCVQLQLLQLGVTPEFELIEQLRCAAGSAVSVASGQVVRDETGVVHLQLLAPVGVASVRFAPGALDLQFEGRAGETEFGGARIGWEIASTPLQGGHAKRASGQETFDADRVGRSVRLRHWQPGDRFQPIGMRRAVKLQDFFTNQKVPRERRHQLILAETAAGEVFWVEGLRIGERFKLTQQTIRRLQWRWQRF
jgi:tRNA(Ile)-lysidine synthase